MAGRPARAIVTLTRDGLRLARRMREAWPGDTVIFGPSCVVGGCGGPGEASTTFAAAEPGVFGWVGPLRKVIPGIGERFDQVVAIMAPGRAEKLVGRLAVVAVDDKDGCAISVLGGSGEGMSELARDVAEVISGSQREDGGQAWWRETPSARIGNEFAESEARAVPGPGAGDDGGSDDHQR